MEKTATQSGDFWYKHARNLNPLGKTEILSEIDVATKGFWGLRCTAHGKFVERIEADPANDKYHRDMFKCPDGDTDMQRLPALLADDVSLVQTPSEVFNRSWWHVTKKPLTELDPSKLIHVGSLSAANHRAVLLAAFNRSTDLYFYEVQLRRESKIEDHLLVEVTHGETVEALFEIKPSPDTPRVHRYINVREAPGSISLVIDAGVIKGFVETVKTANPWR